MLARLMGDDGTAVASTHTRTHTHTHAHAHTHTHTHIVLLPTSRRAPTPHDPRPAACLWSLATSIPLILALKDQKGHGEELRRIGARWGSNRLMVAMLAMLLDA